MAEKFALKASNLILVSYSFLFASTFWRRLRIERPRELKNSLFFNRANPDTMTVIQRSGRNIKDRYRNIEPKSATFIIRND